MEFQKDELNEILNIFQQESAEIISAMDEKLLRLEKEEKDDKCFVGACYGDELLFGLECSGCGRKLQGGLDSGI